MKREYVNTLEYLSLNLEGVTSLLLAVSEGLRYGAYNEKSYIDGIDMIVREMQNIVNEYNQTVDNIIHDGGLK